MKKLLLCGVILSLAALSGQFAIAETKPVTSEPAQEVNSKTSSWLGVWIEKLPVSLSKHLSSLIKEDQGLIIKKILPDSPADKAGLATYDIIAKINDKDIFTQQQLVQMIHKTQPGTKVKLDIIRQGKLLNMEAIVTAAPNQRMTGRQLQVRHFPTQKWMNDPFFNHGFNHNFNQQFKRMQQQLNQLQQHQQQLYFNQQQQLQQQNSWSQFESIQIESTDNKQRAVVRYDDGKGNKKEFVFTGEKDDIRQQINDNKDMDEDKKQNLLNALDMNKTPINNFYRKFPMPGWFHH